MCTNHSILSPSQPLYLPENNLFSAGLDTAWYEEQLLEHTDKTDRNWQAVRDYRDSLDNESPKEKAHRYFARYPNYPPDRFCTSTRQRLASAKRALQPTGWATKLFKQLNHPSTPAYFYSLHMTHLGLPLDYSDPRYTYYPLVVEEIKAAITRFIPKPYAWKLEVGNEGAVHLHIIGGYAPKLAHLIFEGSKVAQRIRPGSEVTLLAYMSKPAAPFTATNYAIYLEAKQSKQTKNLPCLSGQRGLKRNRLKGNPSDLRAC
jgi:hypothetical protein